MRLDRLLAITVIMLNRERISARDLAKRFEVSVRTIYRDLDAIDQAGIPIVSYAGNQGGYGILNTFKLDHQLMTVRDVNAIMTALKGVRSALDDRSIDDTLEKVSGLIPPDRANEVRDLANQVAIDMLPWGVRPSQRELMKRLHQAIGDEKLIVFDYMNWKGEVLQRRVEPLTLVMKGTVWYLFAYCYLREDFRVFRLSRVRGLQVLDETFARRQADYHDYFHGQVDGLPVVDLELRFAPEMKTTVMEYFEENDLTQESDGSLLAKISFPETPWIYSFILSYGDKVEVLSPEHVRHKLGDTTRHMANLYPDSQP